MPWHFTYIDNDSRIVTDPASLTVQARGELSPLQIFVREVLQNALDNKAGSEPVLVRFRLKVLQGHEKDQFLKTLQFDQIAPHIQAVRKYADENKRESDLPEPSSWRSPDTPLNLLYVEDFNTRGLIGPEHSLEAIRFPKPHCFLGLCRNIGDSQKVSDTMGGIYGLGKTVLWKHSRPRIVLFHSRLQTPYSLEDDPQTFYWTRFFGHIRLPGHHIARQSFKGEGFWGHRRGDLTWSYLDSDAEMWAREFGMKNRQDSHNGTSILIVDFEDPDSDSGQTSPQNTLDRIREAAEDYFWPAITDGSLSVFTRFESDPPVDSGTRDILEVPHLSPFIKAYIAARLESTKSSIVLRPVEVNVPKGPGAEPKCKSSAAVCVSLKSEEAESTKFINKTALIRGAGMVVGYQRIGRPGIGGADFYAVVLGGRSCPEYLSAGAMEQERCEQLLAYSEPVTHDVWSMNCDKLKHWYGARAELGRLLDGIKQAILKATTEDSRPEGKASSLLSTMFPLSHGTEIESARDTKLEFLSRPELTSQNGDRKYEFAIRITVPAREEFLGGPYSYWKVECKYGFLGEDIHRKVLEKAQVEFTHIRWNGEDWKPLDEPVSAFEAPVGDQAAVCDLKGQTASLEKFLSTVTKQELQIKVSKR